jgi:mannosyltransferase
MIIYDNIIFTLQKVGGISVYWYELIKRQQNNNSIIYYEESSQSNNIYRSKLQLQNNQIITNTSKMPLCIKRYLPISLNINSINNEEKKIFHSSYYRILNSKNHNIKQVVTVHDFIYDYFKSGFKQKIHIRQRNGAMENADIIICVSKNTKKDLLRLYPQFSKKRIEVIYNGVSNSFKPNNVNCINNNLLFIGGRSNHKNFSFVIDLLYELKDYKLTIIGQPLTITEIKKLETKIKDRYTIYSNIGEDKLNELYNHSMCLIYPSSYEGFGIPVLEAMQAGCPVITLKTSSLPEVCGDAGLMIETLSIKDFINGIKYIEKNRDSLINEGFKHSSKFSWDKCFDQTYSIYNSLL